MVWHTLCYHNVYKWYIWLGHWKSWVWRLFNNKLQSDNIYIYLVSHMKQNLMIFYHAKIWFCFALKITLLKKILNFQDRISRYMRTKPICPTSPLCRLTSPYFLQREKSLLPKILGQLEPWCQLKVKVTIEGHKFEPWISCQRHISFTPGRIFIKLWSNVHLSEIMCRTHNSTMPTQDQGHNWRSRVWAFNFVSAPYSFTSGRIFIKFWSNIWLSAMKCHLVPQRIPPPSGFEPGTPWSKVVRANHLAMR